ncbi:MAG: NAD(P)H-hydrate epimerase [Phycisphaerae bacterium]|nr:NAD(P)H-hydrate epimerase [Phycisphaerae bacterium]
MSIPYVPGEPLSCEQIRQLDALAIEQIGVPGVVLMENAGRGIAEFVYECLVNPAADQVLILCGAGNNGGDGLVVARHLSNAGVRVTVALSVPPEKLKGDAATNMRIVERMDIPRLHAFEAAGLDKVRAEAQHAAIIVDALLGTGSRGAPRGVMAELVEIANAAPRARRIAVDIPSGLDGDTGQASEPCFRADATVTMVAAKAGFSAPSAAAYVGRVVIVGIGAPRTVIAPGRVQ